MNEKTVHHTADPTRPESPPDTRSSTLVVERDGKRYAVVVLSDLDGTVNNELLEEKDRLSSTGPAREALREFETRNIPVGGISARSAGEVTLYLNALGTTGISIGEDGAVALVGKSLGQAAQETLSSRFTVIPHGENLAVVLSKTTPESLRGFITDMQEKLIASGSNERIISTVTSTAEEVQQAAGHKTVELAALSADRLATAYIAAPTPFQEQLIPAEAGKYGLRTFQRQTDPGKKPDVILIFPQDAHKGHALELLNEHASLFFPGLNVDGILPIVIGNHTNDIPLWERAHAMGGFGILVANPRQENGQYTYAVATEQIPDYVIKATQPYGYGIQETVPQVLAKLQEQYNIPI